MESRFKNISANNDLDYYANSWLNNGFERNRTFTFDTIQYFKKTSRNAIFQPLEFLNLLYEQINFFHNNVSKPYTTIKHLRELPITSEEKHILFGFILKCYGGYPYQVNSYIPHSVCLKLLENEFLSFELDTPEKQYCLQESSETVILYNPMKVYHRLA